MVGLASSVEVKSGSGASGLDGGESGGWRGYAASEVLFVCVPEPLERLSIKSAMHGTPQRQKIIAAIIHTVPRLVPTNKPINSLSTAATATKCNENVDIYIQKTMLSITLGQPHWVFSMLLYWGHCYAHVLIILVSKIY